MARAGPNQDINNPTTMLEVGKTFYDKSVDFGILQAVSNTGNPNATGPPVTPITIPLKLFNGSTYSLDCSRITDQFTVDESRLGQSVINTYIDLAERFRDYYEVLKASLIGLSDYYSESSTTISPIASGSTPPTPPDFMTHASGSFGGTSYDIDSILFFTSYDDTPVWSGNTPTNYNVNTYPQLLEAANSLDSSFIDNSDSAVDEVYWWDRYFGAEQGFGAFPPALATRIRLEDRFQATSGFPNDYIQIVNPSPTSNKTIDISITADYTGLCNDAFASRSEVAQLSIIFGLGQHNDFASVSPSSVHQQQSFTGSFSGTRNINLTLAQEIIIPPKMSAFVKTYALITASTPTNTGPASLVGDTATIITGQPTLAGHAAVTVNYPTHGNNTATAY